MLFRSNDTATTEIYTTEHTLSLHDALPISVGPAECRECPWAPGVLADRRPPARLGGASAACPGKFRRPGSGSSWLPNRRRDGARPDDPVRSAAARQPPDQRHASRGGGAQRSRAVRGTPRRLHGAETGSRQGRHCPATTPTRAPPDRSTIRARFRKEIRSSPAAVSVLREVIAESKTRDVYLMCMCRYRTRERACHTYLLLDLARGLDRSVRFLAEPVPKSRESDRPRTRTTRGASGRYRSRSRGGRSSGS